MSTRNRLIALGVATLLIGVIATFPAAVAYNWLAPPQLQLDSVSGTIWRGRASAGTVNGLYIANIDWRMRPLALATGKLAFTTHSEPASGYVDATIAVSPVGTIKLSDVSGRVPLSTFQNSFQLQGFNGQLHIEFDELVVADGMPVQAAGSLSIAGLVAPALSSAPIGDFRADFSSDDNGVQAVIIDEAGVIDVNGNLRIGSDRTYSLTGKVAAAPNAPPGLQQQLRYLGSPDAEGKRDFRIEGSL